MEMIMMNKNGNQKKVLYFATSMLSGTRRNLTVPFVINPNGNDIVSLVQKLGDMDTEPSIAAFMPTGQIAVHKYLGYQEHAFKLQVNDIVVPVRFNLHMFAVLSVSDIPFIFHKVRGTERMGQPDMTPCGIVIIRLFPAMIAKSVPVSANELPFPVEIDFCPRFFESHSYHYSQNEIPVTLRINP
jgi:hypothetical protein